MTAQPLPPEVLAASYVAACPEHFEGARVEVVVPARGDVPERVLCGGLSDAVVRQPGCYVVPGVHDGAPCVGVLTVSAPLVQLFVAGEVIFVLPQHLVRVHTDPSRRIADAPRPKL